MLRSFFKPHLEKGSFPFSPPVTFMISFQIITLRVLKTQSSSEQQKKDFFFLAVYPLLMLQKKDLSDKQLQLVSNRWVARDTERFDSASVIRFVGILRKDL